jgi:hypothetical protein
MRFAIIDLANLFARAQHVTQGDAFTKAGMALHIIFRSLRKLHRDMKVDHLVFCAEGRSWRYDAFPEYKARRKLEKAAKSAREKEEDEVFYEVQKNVIDYLAEKTRCTVLQSQGVEGDDFVARWIQLHPADDHIILSGDSDFVQLLAPNVTLVDGVQERIITTSGVKTFAGEDCVFNVDPGSGKIKVPGTIEECRKKHDKIERDRAKRTGSTPTPFSWEPPKDDWWRRALFVKCIRGDVGDGIFSSYPGVRYEGSSKKTGIREAWEDRNAGGYNWNNLMLARWEKLMGKDAEGKPLVKEVQVRDEYRFNESLIDLTKQPDRVKELMDSVIIQAVQKEPVGNVGFAFIKFCAQNDLPMLQREAADHSIYLNAPYAQKEG